MSTEVYPQEDDQLSADELLWRRVWRVVAPLLETFQSEQRKEPRFCRTAHFYTEKRGRHDRKSLHNSCFSFSFWRKAPNDKVQLKTRCGNIWISCQFSYYICLGKKNKEIKEKAKRESPPPTHTHRKRESVKASKCLISQEFLILNIFMNKCVHTLPERFWLNAWRICCSAPVCPAKCCNWDVLSPNCAPWPLTSLTHFDHWQNKRLYNPKMILSFYYWTLEAVLCLAHLLKSCILQPVFCDWLFSFHNIH